jgi:hypothetical protein
MGWPRGDTPLVNHFPQVTDNQWRTGMYMKLQESGKESSTMTDWLKRMGFAGFTFFFLKGMLWLLVPWLAHSVLM